MRDATKSHVPGLCYFSGSPFNPVVLVNDLIGGYQTIVSDFPKNYVTGLATFSFLQRDWNHFQISDFVDHLKIRFCS
jgi:hypothetical protein